MNRVLCFGDSLTYGQVPGTIGATIERFDESIRWTSRLQHKLSSEFTIIEEGLPSRTIDIEDPRPGKAGRNGKAYLFPCIESHLPLDLVIVWLGTNDTKDIFDKSATDIATSMNNLLTELITLLKFRASKAQVILITPILLDAKNSFLNQDGKLIYEHALPKLKKLPGLYRDIANNLGIEFIDMQSKLSIPKTLDATHLSPEQNEQVASIIHSKIELIRVTE